MTLPAACRPASATEDGRTTSRKRIAIVGAIILLVLAGCGRSESAGEAGDITVRVTTDPAPAIVGPARIVMLLTDRSNTPISGATIRIESTMSHAGMLPVIRDAVETTRGQYEVDDFEFTMAGNWVLVVSGTTSAGDPLRKQVDIGAVRIGSPSVDQPLIPSERCYSTPTPTVQD